MSDGQLEPVTYSNDSAPIEVRDLAHMIPPLVYPEVHVCPILWFDFLQNLWDWRVLVIHAISCTVQIITAKNHIPVSYIVCLTTFTAPNFVHTMETVRIFQRFLLTILICSCNFNEFLNWIFLTILLGRCLSKFILLFFLYCLSYFVTCVEPKVNITYKNQQGNMVCVLYTLNHQLYTN